MNLFIFKPKNDFFSGGRRKKLKRPQMKTCTDRPVKKEAQNDDDHRRTWRSVFKVGNATTTTTTFFKKIHFRCSSTENPTKCEIMQILCKFLVTNFF